MDLNANITLKDRFAKQGGTVIDVIDNGPGIPDELLDEVFVPFSQLSAKVVALDLP